MYTKNDYISDIEMVEVSIFYLFPFLFSPWTVSTKTTELISYEFWKLFIRFEEEAWGHQFIILQRKIPKKLFVNIQQNIEETELYLRWYLMDALNVVNDFLVSKILEFSYFSVNFPSQFNVSLIWINTLNWNKINSIMLNWYKLSPFPFSKKFNGENNEYQLEILFSMKSFFEWNLNETLRRLYSSVDSYCKIKNIKSNVIELWKLLDIQWWKIIPNTVFENIKIWFQWRWLAIHEWKTIANRKWFFLVYRLIRTFCYFYRIVDTQNFDYFLELEWQFIKTKSEYAWWNLDYWFQDGVFINWLNIDEWDIDEYFSSILKIGTEEDIFS